MRRFIAFLGLALLMSAGPAMAALTLQLTPANTAAAPGATVTFQGVLTNTSATSKLFLNDLQATLTGASISNLTLKTNTFFANVPGILLPGETYNGPLFQIKLNTTALGMDYPGNITIQGGADIFASDTLATTPFTLNPTPVEQWRYNTFGASANSAAASDLADWDHDGVPNLLEYALGMDGKTEDRNSLPKALTINNHLALSYVPSATDVTYSVESSTDLITWTTANVEAVSIANPDPPGSVTFRYKFPLGAAGPAFLRIKVTR